MTFSLLSIVPEGTDNALAALSEHSPEQGLLVRRPPFTGDGSGVRAPPTRPSSSAGAAASGATCLPARSLFLTSAPGVFRGPFQRTLAPYTWVTVIVMSTLRSDTITDRYSSQSGCSPAARR